MGTEPDGPASPIADSRRPGREISWLLASNDSDLAIGGASGSTASIVNPDPVPNDSDLVIGSAFRSKDKDLFRADSEGDLSIPLTRSPRLGLRSSLPPLLGLRPSPPRLGLRSPRLGFLSVPLRLVFRSVPPRLVFRPASTDEASSTLAIVALPPLPSSPGVSATSEDTRSELLEPALFRCDDSGDGRMPTADAAETGSHSEHHSTHSPSRRPPLRPRRARSSARLPAGVVEAPGDTSSSWGSSCAIAAAPMSSKLALRRRFRAKSFLSGLAVVSATRPICSMLAASFTLMLGRRPPAGARGVVGRGVCGEADMPPLAERARCMAAEFCVSCTCPAPPGGGAAAMLGRRPYPASIPPIAL
mmetsp:Transcript_74278/g.204636  ORF Transcript_74278/g.204636 Transcript_74278/m.204636 type:complete len:360 (-) Transcript_74278:506-1585(-)